MVSEQDLARRVGELGAQITRGLRRAAQPLLVGVLKGAFVFMSDLARAISIPVEFDFMAVSSYGSSTRTSGVVRIVKDLDLDLAGRHVLLVEDIVDSGLTLSYLRKNLLARNPASLGVCALLVRDELVIDESDLTYVGFRIAPAVGRGLRARRRGAVPQPPRRSLLHRRDGLNGTSTLSAVSPLVMGVLHLGGMIGSPDETVARGLELAAEGADIVDVTGALPDVKTDVAAWSARSRPGCGCRSTRRTPRSRRSPWARARPSSTTCPPSLWPIAAEAGAGWIAVHGAEPSIPRWRRESVVRGALVERASAALEGGVDEVWIDPGVGFGKSLARA